MQGGIYGPTPADHQHCYACHLRAILSWQRSLYPNAARIVGSNTSLFVFQERQRDGLQIEPADSLGVVRSEAMPLDAVPAELPTAFIHLAGIKA
jgi:hypothetical protein